MDIFNNLLRQTNDLEVNSSMAYSPDIIAYCPINKKCGLIKGSKLPTHYFKFHRGQEFPDHLFTKIQLETVPKNSKGCPAFSIEENWDEKEIPANRQKELIQQYQEQPIQPRFVNPSELAGLSKSQKKAYIAKYSRQ